MGENIADNGGLREALYGYRRYLRTAKNEKKLPGSFIYQKFPLNKLLKNLKVLNHLVKNNCFLWRMEIFGVRACRQLA